MAFPAIYGRAVGGMLLITAAWGASFPLVQWAIRDLGVYPFLFLRFASATVLLLLLAGRQLRQASRDTRCAGILLGVILWSAFATQTEGLRLTTASNSALLTGLYLLGVPVIQRCWQQRLITVTTWLGIGIAFGGMLLLTGYSWNGFNAGDALTLLCAGTYTAHLLYTEHTAKRHAILPLVTLQIATTAIVSGVVVLARGTWPVQITPAHWGIILGTGLVCTVLALLMQTWAQRHIPATRIGILASLEGLFGLLAGIILAHDVLTPLSTLGAILMVAGTVCAEVGGQTAGTSD